MQMICDRLHGRIACEPLPCHNLYPCTPTVRLDARLLTCYCFYYALYLWCDAWWRIVWVVKALGASNVVTTGEILACVLGVWWGLSQPNRILRWFFGWVLPRGCDLGFPMWGTCGGYMWDEEVLGWSVWQRLRGLQLQQFWRRKRMEQLLGFEDRSHHHELRVDLSWFLTWRQ